MKDQPLPKDEQGRHPMYTVVLVALESLLTFLLQYDRSVRQLAKGLIEREAVIEVRTYLPAETFYATFTTRGVLLDFALPTDKTVDGRVTASFTDLVRAFMTAPPHVLEKLLLEGSEAVVVELRQLMASFNIQHILTSWWRTGLFGKSQPQPKTNQRIRTLMKKTEYQQQQIEQLTLQTHEQSYELRHMQYRYRRLQWVTSAIIVLLFVLLMLSVFLK
ncbi:MAG: hypothetical protein RLY58_1674 [Pseudomonadota bacterium]|jgi:hypothetical protein